MKKLFLIPLFCFPMILYAQYNLQSVKNIAQMCVTCHGPQGISATALWPNLAGQHEHYLLKQLREIKQGTLRSVPAMMPSLSSLQDKDLQELSQYYASMHLPQGFTPIKYLSRGQELYRGGDFNKHITACIACHGPKGTGNNQAGFPVLSGQNAAYTVAQLQAFKKGLRKNDLNHIMQDISAQMSTADMEAVAHYVEGLY